MRALAFSGGKDSLACWHLCRPAMVIWVNTGKTYPETRRIIDQVARECHTFIEVPSDREAQNARAGLPSDVVPANATVLGQAVTGAKPVGVQSYLECCWENISKPLNDAARANGVTHLISGQRQDEAYKGSAKHGQMVDGIVREMPIEFWTSADVLAFLSSRMEIPEHFRIEHSSLDCYDCTAYVEHSRDRIKYTRQHHPVFFREYEKRMSALQGAIFESVRPYHAAATV